MKRISIFGVTGSIGANTVSVVESLGAENFRTVAVSGNANITGLAEAAKRLQAEVAVTADPGRLEDLRTALEGAASRPRQGRRHWPRPRAARWTG